MNDEDKDKDPGVCVFCGAPFVWVRPGKVQETCDCFLPVEGVTQGQHKQLLQEHAKLIVYRDHWETSYDVATVRAFNAEKQVTTIDLKVKKLMEENTELKRQLDEKYEQLNIQAHNERVLNQGRE
jgi:hypothetical protein